MLLAATLLGSLAVWAAFAWRVITDPGNHTGIEPLWAIVPLVLPAVVAWLPSHAEPRTLRPVVTAWVVLSVIALVAMDRANVLVQHERWIRRGMPERPCGPIARDVWACCSTSRDRVRCSEPRWTRPGPAR